MSALEDWAKSRAQKAVGIPVASGNSLLIYSEETFYSFKQLRSFRDQVGLLTGLVGHSTVKMRKERLRGHGKDVRSISV